MVGEIGSALLALGMASAVAFGILAMFPRSPKGVVLGTVAILFTFGLLTLIGSGLVGPVDLRPMLIWGPFGVLCAVIWSRWKVRLRVTK